MAATTGCTRTLPTQPEFGICFLDVGCAIENHGVDPDEGYEVDYAPQDYVRGIDPQLVGAIAAALAQIRKHPSTVPATDPLRSDDHDQDLPQAG